ncbi:MAG: histidine--tRNA ligase [Clostridiales bacterium]|nr:histidine--tRNA ligase [Clostridiales bacterium]
MINIPKGTKDMLPKDSFKWRKVRNVVDELSRKYNLKEIATPGFESTELFVRTDGESSDIVNKEMYTFLDKGGRSITLKPEGTAGVVRSFIENGLGNDVLPLKLFYITPCYRYEKPQAGRLREHHQFGCEIFGANSLASDVETILIALDFYKGLGIEPTIHINFLGCDECKAKYKELLKEYTTPKLDDMCEDCHKRYDTNILRMLDCKSTECKSILAGAPKVTECLCEECSTKFENLKKSFDSFNIKYVVDSKLVRGLDYYTDFVFEFIDEDKTLGQNALGAGGRYDNLVSSLGGKPTPTIGFGIGIERLLLYIESKGIELKDDRQIDVYVASLTNDVQYVFKFVKALRDAGFATESDLMNRSFKAQFKYADKLNAKFVVTIGDDEIKEGKLSIKNMQTGEQVKMTQEEIMEFLSKNV